MKKIMILAVAAIALVACSRTFETQETEGVAIGFNTWTEVLTKARTQGDNTFTEGDTFAVFGYKEVTSPASKTTVFNNVTVTRGATDVWTYSPVRFWDQSTDSYTFYAVSPSGVVTLDPQGGNGTSGSATFYGNDSDFLVADKTTVAKANYAQKVNLKFNHIASLVDFKVKKHTGLGNAVLTVSNITLSNLDNTGTFTVANTYATANHPDVTWAASAHTGSYTQASGVTPVTLPSEATDVSTTGATVINHLIAMPQVFRTDGTAQTVRLQYAITDEAGNVSSYDSTFNLKLFDKTEDDGNNDILIDRWEAGNHYTFIITVNANVIEFGASITDWTTVANGYNYLLN